MGLGAAREKTFKGYKRLDRAFQDRVNRRFHEPEPPRNGHRSDNDDSPEAYAEADRQHQAKVAAAQAERAAREKL